MARLSICRGNRGPHAVFLAGWNGFAVQAILDHGEPTLGPARVSAGDGDGLLGECCLRHCVRAVKEMDSTSIGLCPQEFESARCRFATILFFRQRAFEFADYPWVKISEHHDFRTWPSPRSNSFIGNKIRNLEKRHLWDSNPRRETLSA